MNTPKATAGFASYLSSRTQMSAVGYATASRWAALAFTLAGGFGCPPSAAPEPKKAATAADSEPQRASTDAVAHENRSLDTEDPPPMTSLRPELFDDLSGRALARFRQALRRSRAGEGQTRIVVYGASHTAGDLYVGPLRDALQAEFGDAGHGFVVAAWPTPDHIYWQSGVAVGRGRGWTALRLDADRTNPDHYGIAGVVFDSEGRDATATIGTEGPGFRTSADTLEVWFQRQPGGGTLELSVDGKPTANIATSARATGAGYHRVALTDAPHSLRLHAVSGGSVRLYGVTLERTRAGIVVDNVALSGSKARNQLKWMDPIYTDHLRRRAPNLVVIAYGGNEGNDFGISINTYATNMERVVRRLRHATPAADCLMLGPADKPMQRAGHWVHRPRTTAISQVQRKLASEIGCAFFDTVAFMGGRLSMLDWVAADPPLAREDHVHLSQAGYRLLSEALLTVLLSDGRASVPPIPIAEALERAHTSPR